MPPATEPIIVSCLLCHAHVNMALTCLASLARFSELPVQLLLHDDGSLTEEDGAMLTEVLPVQQIVWRREADERMAEVLRRYPAYAAFRQQTPIAMKLCDLLTYNTSEIYAYTDADVLFFRPFTNIFQLPDPKVNALYLHDAWDNCYSFRSWDLVRCPQIKLPDRFNSGLMCFRRSAYDLDFIEWFLSNPLHKGNPHHGLPEQTAWAVLSKRVGCRKWNPMQMTVMLPSTPIDSLVAGHFTYFTRERLEACASAWQTATAQAPEEVTTIEAGDFTALGLLRTEVRRVSRRVMSRITGRR